MAHWMAEAAAEQHALGLFCSFDCARCEARMRMHSHPCVVCAEPVVCDDEHWEPEDAPLPGLVRCNAHGLLLALHGPEAPPGSWF